MPHPPSWKIYEDTAFNDRYHLLELLGVGGFGAVFKADEVLADRWLRTVALKIITTDDPQDLESCIREFQTTAALTHPNLLTTYGITQGQLKGMACTAIVMELGGQDLSHHLGYRKISQQEAKKIITDIAKALDFLVQHKITHRDIKPQNILPVERGGITTWKVADLGIARSLGTRSVTKTRNPIGSLPYMSPEAFKGEIRPQMDIWALGVVITQLLTHKLPFPGPSIAEISYQVLHEKPQIPPLPAPFDRIVAGCLEQDPQKRWSATQILDALANISPQPTPEPPPPQVHPLDNIRLNSSKGADYQPLRDLLKQQHWQAADYETRRIMCTVADRHAKGYLRAADFHKFPAIDLQTIDRLWVTASQGRYGFSVQRRIYQRCGAKLDGRYPGDSVWYRFCRAVGWRANHAWLSYEELSWDQQGPEGHLPYRVRTSRRPSKTRGLRVLLSHPALTNL